MKHYYRVADACMQVLLLVSVTYALIWHFEKLLPVITATAVWYIISICAHIVIGSHSYKVVYTSYGYVTTVIIALLGVGYFFPLVLFLDVYCLIFAAPALAVCYTCNCFAEILHLRKRPISYLK